MPKRPFLVTPDHECIPLEGPYRVEPVRGEWWVLGEHRAVRCDGLEAARSMLDRMRTEHDAHELVAEALEGLSDDFDVVLPAATPTP